MNRIMLICCLWLGSSIGYGGQVNPAEFIKNIKHESIFISEHTRGKMYIDDIRLHSKPGTWWQAGTINFSENYRIKSPWSLMQTNDILSSNKYCPYEKFSIKEHALYWSGPIIVSEVYQSLNNKQIAIKTIPNITIGHKLQGLSLMLKDRLISLLENDPISKQLMNPIRIHQRSILIKTNTPAVFMWFNPLLWRIKGDFTHCTNNVTLSKTEPDITLYLPIYTHPDSPLGLYGLYHICNNTLKSNNLFAYQNSIILNHIHNSFC